MLCGYRIFYTICQLYSVHNFQWYTKLYAYLCFEPRIGNNRKTIMLNKGQSSYNFGVSIFSCSIPHRFQDFDSIFSIKQILQRAYFKYIPKTIKLSLSHRWSRQAKLCILKTNSSTYYLSIAIEEHNVEILRITKYAIQSSVSNITN